MKFHKFISGAIVATALLGVTLGGTMSNGISASASQQQSPSSDSSSNTPSSGGSSNTSNTPSSDSSSNTPSSNIQYSKNKSSGSSSTNSTSSSTYINNGSLTLDSVPTLNFQSNNGENNSTLPLNGSGQIKVTDYRNRDNNGTTGNWELYASSNGFNLKNSTNNSSDNNNWQMNLATNDTKLDSFSGKGINGSDITGKTKINPVHLNTNSNSSNNNTNEGNILSSGSYGITQLTLNNNNANLNIPNVQPDANNPYTTTMNWNLNSATNDNIDN